MPHPLEKEAKERLFKYCDEAIASANGFEHSTFSVQTLFDKKTLAHEDNYFDGQKIENCMALKNILNSDAIKYIEKTTGLRASSTPDAIFNLDFKQNKGWAKSTNLYIFGHYIKKSREYCQHDWACFACRGKGCKKCNFKKENYPSIEGSFRSVFASAFEASDMKLHASGREDVDVMTYGSGRPFVAEIINPKKRSADLIKISSEIENKFPLEAIGLQFCPHFWIETICTSHFDKHYRAIIACNERKLSKTDFELLSSKIPVTLRQKTPIRVVKRRADLLRHRRVYSIELHNIIDGKLIVDIWAEAGTYIKELIHGDSGRTMPSVSSILGGKCTCEQLDVISIDDSFIKTLRK